MEEVKTTEMIVEESVGETTARQELEALLNEILPEEEHTGDVDQMALDYIKKMNEMNNRLVQSLANDPRMAQILAEVMNGGKAGISLIRHLGKSYLEAEEGTPEYDEIMAAENEYQAGREKMKADKEAFDTKSNAFYAAFGDYCQRKSLNEEVYLVKIEDKIVLPLFEMEASDALFGSLVKAVDYDKDVEDAFEAGELKARNMNINEMRARPSDGMPKGLSSQGIQMEEKPKRPMNSLLAKALNA